MRLKNWENARSEYGFLRTARRPIRMQDSSKPYNSVVFFSLYATNMRTVYFRQNSVFHSSQTAFVFFLNHYKPSYLSTCKQKISAKTSAAVKCHNCSVYVSYSMQKIPSLSGFCSNFLLFFSEIHW